MWQHKPHVVAGKQGCKSILELVAEGLEGQGKKFYFILQAKLFEQASNMIIDKRQSFK